jgi:trehalose-phosphatase
LRAKEITGNLKYAAADMGLQLIEGNKVIEIKSANINKGNAAKEWIKRYPSDFILAIGDDFTDEDTFKAMPEGAVTIKVGPECLQQPISLKTLQRYAGSWTGCITGITTARAKMWTNLSVQES